MILYRVTSAAVAAGILARGFKDSTRPYGSQSARKGVWFSDRPLHAYADIWSDTVLAVEFEGPEFRTGPVRIGRGRQYLS